MKKIRIAAAQYPLSFHKDFSEWQAHTEKWVQSAVGEKAQVLVFPEYASMELVSLFSEVVRADLQLQVTEMSKLEKFFIETFVKLAQKYQVAILTPSIPLQVAHFSRPVNRAFFVAPEGQVGYQDKIHMTRFEDEAWGVGPGDMQLPVFEAFGIKFGINICFDVEFPKEAHLLAKKGVEVLLAPSCTETLKGLYRVHVGARARALENQFYVVVAQTVGEAPWAVAADINTGQAAFYSTCDAGFPDDGILKIGPLQNPQWLVQELDIDLLTKVRSQGQVFNYKNMLSYNW